jgi:hypothetical protein
MKGKSLNLRTTASTAIVGTLILLAITGCAASKPAAEQVVGTWKCVATGVLPNVAARISDVYLVPDATGTLTLDPSTWGFVMKTPNPGQPTKWSGTWKVSGGKLNVTFTDPSTGSADSSHYIKSTSFPMTTSNNVITQKLEDPESSDPTTVKMVLSQNTISFSDPKVGTEATEPVAVTCTR